MNGTGVTKDIFIELPRRNWNERPEQDLETRSESGVYLTPNPLSGFPRRGGGYVEETFR